MHDNDPRDTRFSLPSVGSSLPEGHFSAGGKDEFISADDYYDRSHLKPLMVAAPIADFFNKLSATLQIVVVSTFMITMIAIPLGTMYAVYNMTANSPNFVVIKQQEERNTGDATESQPAPSEPTGIRSAD